AGRPGKGPGEAELARLVRELNDDSFEVRQRAEAELAKAGRWAKAVLRRAAAKPASAEVRRRAERLLAALAPSRPNSADRRPAGPWAAGRRWSPPPPPRHARPWPRWPPAPRPNCWPARRSAPPSGWRRRSDSPQRHKGHKEDNRLK